MKRRGVARAVMTAAIALVMEAGATSGAARGGLAVEAGLGGRWRVGAWTPVVVSGSDLSAGQEVWVSAEDDDGQLVRSPAAAAVRVGDRVEARLCVRFGRPSGHYRVEVGGGVAVEDRLVDPIASTDHLIVAYGDLAAVARAARLVDRERGTSTSVVVASPPHAAVATALGFDAADAIVLTGSAAVGLPADVRAGIDAWVRSGGSLVFSCGATAVDVVDAGPPAADWLPGRFERLVRLRRPGPLEAYARSGGLVDRLPADGMAVPRFAGETSGVVLVAAAEPGVGPVVTRSAHGLGTVTWLGVDLDVEPVRGWSGCDTLLAAALGGRSRGGLDRRRGDHGGMPDLAGQLHAALDTFSASSRPAGDADAGRPSSPVPFEVVAGLGLLYVLCLYPLDWWFVSRRGRPWLAWLTLPLLAAGFTAAAWGLKGRWSGATSITARAADVIDFTADGGTVRATAWLAAHSPTNDRLDISATAAPAVERADGAGVVTWWGMAGRGFGGLDATVPHPSLAASEYRYGGSPTVLEGVPIAAAASRLFEAAWSGSTGEPIVTSSLAVTPQATLAGRVSHHLPFTLEQCRLLHAGWLYDAGRLRPGEPYDTATGRGPRSLASALTRRAAARDRESPLTWDPTTRDVARIIEVAAFHGAAGGAAYTGLDAGRLGRLDLSPLLPVYRAVLVGVVAGAGPATRWGVGGTGGPVAVAVAAPTLCRIVIPLAGEAAP